MKKQSKGLGIRFAEDLHTIEELTPYLCTAAVVRGGPPEKRGPQPKVCRACEVQCAYGRRLVKLWDAQPKEGAEPMPTVKKSADQMTLQEQLEAKIQECMQLHEANKTMISEVLELTHDLEEARGRLAKAEAELVKMSQARQETQVELWKLKAKLYDKEHEWED